MNQDLLKDLHAFLKEEFAKKCIDIDKDGACLSASTIAHEILMRLRYVCSLRRVEILVANDEGKKILNEWTETGKMLSREEVIARGGWIIGLGTTGDDFHYLLYFPLEDSIMDLTFGITNRPDHGIATGPMWVTHETFPSCLWKINPLPDEGPRSTPSLDDKLWVDDVVIRGRAALLKYRVVDDKDG